MNPTNIPFIAVVSVMGILFALTTYNLIQNIQECKATRDRLDRLEQEMLKEGIPFLSYKLRGMPILC